MMIPRTFLAGLIVVFGAVGVALGQPVDYPRLDQATYALLYDPDVGHRVVAAQRLGELGDAAGVEALIRALERDPESTVRAVAAESLGQIGAADALAPLREAADNDPDLVVRREAARAVGRIEERGRQTRQPIVRTVIRNEPYISENRDRVYIDGGLVSSVGPGAVLYGSSVWVTGGGPVIAVPGVARKAQNGPSLEERERQRQLLLYYYWPDGRPRKYYSGSPSTKPPIYPTLGGKAPLNLLKDPYGRNEFGRPARPSSPNWGMASRGGQRMNRARVSPAPRPAARAPSHGTTRSGRPAPARTVQPLRSPGIARGPSRGSSRR
jgi:hypothetical protein